MKTQAPTKRATRRLGGVLIVCVACAAAVAGQGSAFLNSAAAVSPDGLNELRLDVGGKRMEYSIWRRGKAIVEPTPISLEIDGHWDLHDNGAQPKIVKLAKFGKTTDVAPVRVMTYNVRNSLNDRNSPDNNWTARREDLARLVESEAPDVIGFQEVLPDQRQWLEERFPQYAFSGCGRNADALSGEASPVAYLKERFVVVTNGTFWLSKTPDAPGSKSWGAKYPRICTWAVLDDKAGGGRFSFANTHTDHKSEAAREKGMLLVIERMKAFGANAPIVLVGDHNCLEYEAPAVAVSKILKDAMYLSETPPEGAWRTFNFWSYKEKELSIVEALGRPIRERSESGDKSDQKRIDYIYVSPGTRVLGYRTLPDTRPGTKLYPSDHFPTVATLVFAPSRLVPPRLAFP